MRSTTKIILWSAVTVLGLALYIVMYFLVPYVREIQSMKYLIVIIGYISILIFPFGIFNLIKEIKNNRQNK